MDATKQRNNSYILEMLKALIIALIISLVLILLLALGIKLLNIPVGMIDIINQVIKGASILIATLFAFRLPKNGWIRGIVLGILYIFLTFVVFSLMDGGFTFGLPLLNDVALGMITGLVSGIISVNLLSRNK